MTVFSAPGAIDESKKHRVAFQDAEQHRGHRLKDSADGNGRVILAGEGSPEA
jgi:hypothetical protein